MTARQRLGGIRRSLPVMPVGPAVARLDRVRAGAERDRDRVGRPRTLERDVARRGLDAVDHDRLVCRRRHVRKILVHELDLRARDVDRAGVGGGGRREQHEADRRQHELAAYTGDGERAQTLTAPHAPAVVLTRAVVAPDLPLQGAQSNSLPRSPSHGPSLRPHAANTPTRSNHLTVRGVRSNAVRRGWASRVVSSGRRRRANAKDRPAGRLTVRDLTLNLFQCAC